MAIVLRVVGVVLLLVAAGIFVWAPWSAPVGYQSDARFVDARGNPLVDDGSFEAVPGMGSFPPHELVRYQMPEPRETPALAEGTTAMTFADLWSDGTMEVGDSIDRLGTPGESEFPAGTTAEDIMLFFLDLEDMRSLQPQEGAVRPELDGKRVRIAGYTTPVGFAEGDNRFLLVPELGACIHVPPPPANQIVFVEEAEGPVEMFEPIWITGTLRADPVATILADVGYRMENVVAERYR